MIYSCRGPDKGKTAADAVLYNNSPQKGGQQMSFLKEFKEFAVKGNVIDMAVGIIIGAAFGKVVSSVVSDVVMPPIGLLIGGMDFSSLAITLKAASNGGAPVVIAYGKFIQTAVDFTIIAFAIFMLIKAINVLKREEAVKEEAPVEAPPTKEELLLTEIRDLLKKDR
jgi:large conductance mechanosensitive channel